MKAATQSPKVCLIVDDEPSIRKTLAITMEGEGWTVRACSVEAALRRLQPGETPSGWPLWLRQGTASGQDILPQLLKLQPGLPVVMITAFASVNTAVEAMRRGAADYLPKPFDAHGCPPSGAPGSGAADAWPTARLGNPDWEPLLESHSPAMRAVLAMAQRAAASDSSLLLAGETGTGKGVLARAVHAWSQRSGKPFAVVACPSLPTELLESELFGHAQGAFTGAYREQA